MVLIENDEQDVFDTEKDLPRMPDLAMQGSFGALSALQRMRGRLTLPPAGLPRSELIDSR